MSTLHVIAAGPSVVTDLGRFRGPGQGLSVNGALDQYAATAANALVGNPVDAPLVEVMAFGLTIVPDEPVLVAVTGAGTEVLVAGEPVATHAPVLVPADQPLVVRPARTGLRNYVAVRGEVEAPRLLGSCAPDTMLGFGRTVTAGSTLTVDAPALPTAIADSGLLDLRAGVRLPVRDGGGHAVLQVVEGPDVEEFADGVATLESGPYKLSPRSNHVGVRLAGPTPRRTATGEVLSRGVPIGAVEVPSGDELLVLMRGRGVTAGYPVLAVLTSLSQDVAAQIRPGQTVVFRTTTVENARKELLGVAAEVDRLRERVSREFVDMGAPVA